MGGQLKLLLTFFVMCNSKRQVVVRWEVLRLALCHYGVW